jgi:glycosyltransferase involved in cell wall biosynthesis
MQKLLIVTRHTPLPWEDGAGAYLHDLARFLAGHGFHVDILWLAPHPRLRWEKIWRLPAMFDDSVHLHLAEGFHVGRRYFFPNVIWLPFKARSLGRARRVLESVGVNLPRRRPPARAAAGPAPTGAGGPPPDVPPPPWASPPTPAELDQVRQFLAANRPDVVLANFSWMGPVLALPELQGARRACLAHDVGWKRALLSAPQLGGDAVPEMSRADEARWLQPASVIIAISAADAAELRPLAPDAAVLVAPKALEVRAALPEADSPRVIFVGSDNAFNVEGLEWFLTAVWPRVRQEVPGATLDVCGSISRAVSLRLEGVTFHGVVPHLDFYYRQAAVAIVPLLRATGLNIKLVEAAAFGRAIVATPATLVGAPFLREAAVVAESPGEFATALRRLLVDPALRAAAATRVLAAVRTHLDPDACYGPLAAWLHARA